MFFQTEVDKSKSESAVVKYAYTIAANCVSKVRKNLGNVSRLPDSAFRKEKDSDQILARPLNLSAAEDFNSLDEVVASTLFENEYDCLSDAEEDERLQKIESLPISKKQKRILAVVALDGTLQDVCEELNMPVQTVQRQIRNIRRAVLIKL